MLARFDATLHNDYDFSTEDPAKVLAMQQTIAASTTQDAWNTFGRWYFAPASMRTVSPLSDLTLESYVTILMEENTKASLEYANELSRGHPAWATKVSGLLQKLPPERSATKTP